MNLSEISEHKKKDGENDCEHSIVVRRSLPDWRNEERRPQASILLQASFTNRDCRLMLCANLNNSFLTYFATSITLSSLSSTSD
jgi:hypothetical protein